jgi:hypothetical protein
MKRAASAKLTVRRETLRALASIELARAVGGDDAGLAETGKELCTKAVVIIKPPRPAG